MIVQPPTTVRQIADPTGVFMAAAPDGTVDATIAEPADDRHARRFVAKQLMRWIKAGLVVTYRPADRPIDIAIDAAVDSALMVQQAAPVATPVAVPVEAFVPARRRKMGRKGKHSNVRKTVQHFAVGENVYLFKAMLNADEFTRWSAYLNHAGTVAETVSNGKGRPRTYKVRFNGDPEPILVRADQLTRGLLDE